MSSLPTGTVTFLFTDIEGSTRLLQAIGDRYGAVLERHRRLIRAAGAAYGGQDFGSEGDALFIVFTSASAAVAAAAEAQRALAAEPWPEDAAIRVRMGVHTGEATLVGDNYVGLDLHRVARIVSAGHGGQVLVSGATVAVAGNDLPDGVTLRDMGERRLKDLLRPEHVFQLVIEGLNNDFPALRTLERTPNNLPTQLTSFVGREREVAEARDLISRARLLTLTGPGGTGKTRLSLQVAAEIAERFPDGAFFVPLDSVTDPDLVASAIVGAIGLQEAGQRTPRERLLDYLRERCVLLVLDNFEQVLGAAPLVADILKTSPTTRVIVSSRAVLHVSGEQEYPVPPLALPEHGADVRADDLVGNEAVNLFVERAVGVKPDFALTDENAAAILGICRRLDGLPLAIELAAARVKLLPPDAILARLDGRLSLLASSSRDLPERQQTLRGAIAWSHDLLEPGRQRLFARFSAFTGGAALEEAEGVCGPADELDEEVLDGLAALVDQSLLRQVETTGEPRFAMLQTIRDFATERLAERGEAEAIRERHARAYLALIKAAAPHLLGTDQRRWLDRLERDADNLRAAMNWFLEHGETVSALEMGAAMWRFWQMRGYLQEGADRMATILAMPRAADDPIAQRHGIEAAGGLAYWRGDMAAAKELYKAASDLARASGDRHAIAEAVYNESFVYMLSLEDVPLGRAMAEESLALFRELGDRPGIAKALWDVGNALYFQEDWSASCEVLLQAIAASREIGDQYGLGWGHHTYGLSSLHLGRNDVARESWVEMLRIFAAAEDVSGIGTALANFRALAVAEGDTERAVRLAGASSAIVQRSGADLASIIEDIDARYSKREGPRLDEATAAKLWAEGAAMPLADAIAYALAPSASATAAAP